MANSMDELSRKIRKGKYERIPGRYSQTLQDFIASTLRVNSKERP